MASDAPTQGSTVESVIKIATLRNGFLLHTQWGRFAYPDVESLLKELKPQLVKLLQSSEYFYQQKAERR